MRIVPRKLASNIPFFVGLCTTPNKIHANIVLAGDPKQLDAMTKSEQAKDLGFRTSFLEHLCERKLYMRHPKSKKFNEKYITQLVRNYRSHPSILKLPNELFYDNTLMAVASDGEILFAVNRTMQTIIFSICFLIACVIPYRHNGLVCKLTFATLQRISDHFQISSVIQCWTIRD